MGQFFFSRFTNRPATSTFRFTARQRIGYHQPQRDRLPASVISTGTGPTVTVSAGNASLPAVHQRPAKTSLGTRCTRFFRHTFGRKRRSPTTTSNLAQLHGNFQRGFQTRIGSRDRAGNQRRALTGTHQPTHTVFLRTRSKARADHRVFCYFHDIS